MKKIRDTLAFKFVETFLVLMGLCYLSLKINVTFLDLGVPFGDFTGQVIFSFIGAVGITLDKQSLTNT